MRSKLLSAVLSSLAAVALMALIVPGTARAEPIVVKLATMAPEGTTWFNGLAAIRDRWSELSDGKVQLKIYAGGVVGNEGSMVRKMRIGQLHGAALSNMGLQDMTDAPQVTNTPMMIRSYGELDYVMERMTPEFETALADAGFVVLNWSDVGWVHFFTNVPIRKPADVEGIKVFAWEGDPAAVEAFRHAGFNPVVIPSVDILPSLNSGLIDGFPNTPLAALSMQWFAMAPNMLDVPWAPLVGATVITQDMWDRIPAEYHEPFMKAAREIGAGLQDDIRRQDAKAVTVMEKYGLNVVRVDAATQAEWQAAAEGVYPIMRGGVVPEATFDRCQALVEEYRRANP